MEQVTFAQLQAAYEAWLELNVTPDANGDRKPNADQVREFLNGYVLNEPGTVYVEGAVATALWSHEIGVYDTQDLAEKLAEISGGQVRVVGTTGAGEFLEWLLTNANVDQTALDATTEYWSSLSAFFVAETEGPLITITPYAGSSTVYFNTEIDSIVANSAIDEINGVAREDIGIDIFSSVTVARKAYLMAVFNGEFAGDILHSTLNTISADGTDFFLNLDADTLAALGLGSVSINYPTGTPELSNAELRAALEQSFSRGLHAALFGPVMAAHDVQFTEFVGDHLDSASADFTALQDAVAGFVAQIFDVDPTADVSSLIAIARQASAEGDDINRLVAYFRLLTEKVQPYIDDAPEELKRDLSQSITEILDAAQGSIDDVPAELQKRLAVTSGGRELYLLDQWRQEVLQPSDPLDATLNGVGVYSQSETDLGTALYLTFGASSGYAIVRNSVEQLIDSVAVPLREKIDAIVEHFDYFEGAERKIVAFLERAADYLGDTLGAPFKDAVFGQFQYADGKAAVQAFDSSLEIGNVLQLQVGADEATLIGNDNNNAALHFGHGNVYGLGGDDKLLGLNSDLGSDGKALELHGGEGDDIIALAFGEGGFAYGDAGEDLLIGGGKEAHLTGGSGNDTFVIGSGTHIGDGETGDSTYFAFIQLFGGVAPWWSETNTAVWAPFTSLSYAFPVIGAELLAVGAIFADAATMNFARYRMTPEGDLQVEIGYGLGGNALIHDYSLDLSTGQGTAGITVFKQGGRGKSAGVDTGVAQYVNLALYAGFGSGLPGYDPLVLDLDGDGFEVTAREYSQVYFDFESTGFAKQTGWVGGDDALLTRDVNGNGAIDDGSELFGNRSQSGFAELGSLDSNSDGLINSSDAEFGSLRIWRDLNQDGVSQANELMTLADAGIASISLATVESPEGTEVRNNVVARTAQFTRTDGTTGTVGDITFDVSDINTRWTGNGDASAAAEALPQLGGLGLVRDLRLVMTDDSQLLTMVNNLVGSTASSLTELFGQVEEILYRWAGVDAVPATALGSNGLDTRKLAFLEQYTGVQLLARDGSGNIVSGASTANVERLWDYQFPRLALKLLAQGPLATQFASLDFHEDIDQFVALAPDAISNIIDGVLDAMPATATEAETYWAQWGTLIGAIAGTTLRVTGASVGSDFFFTQLVAAVDGRTLPLTISQLADTLAIDGIHIGSQEALTRTSAHNGTQVWYAVISINAPAERMAPLRLTSLPAPRPRSGARLHGHTLRRRSESKHGSSRGGV